MNTLTLFYANGRGHQLPYTFAWVQDVLINRGYIDGTRYYVTPECFLFFMGRLLDRIKGTKADLSLRPIFRQRVRERIGSQGDALALAMRVLACASAGVCNDVDLRTLLTLQQEDGGWEAGWMYRYGRSGIKIGNRGLTTALAINAIQALSPLSQTAPQISVINGYRFPNMSPNFPVVGTLLQRLARVATYQHSPYAGEWIRLLWKWLYWPCVNIVTRVYFLLPATFRQSVF